MLAEVVQIWIVRGQFDLDAFFADNTKAPVSETIRWACQVPGREVFRVPERGEVYTYKAAP